MLKKVIGLIYPILRNLKIDLKRKIGLFGLFSLGVFSLFCNVGKSVALLQPPFVYGYIWATTEISVAVICASIPAMRPLFDKKSWVRSSREQWSNISGGPASRVRDGSHSTLNGAEPRVDIFKRSTETVYESTIDEQKYLGASQRSHC